MEIEGSEKNIKKVAKILGYDTKEGIKKSYRKYFEAIDKKKKEWLFVPTLHYSSFKIKKSGSRPCVGKK